MSCKERIPPKIARIKENSHTHTHTLTFFWLDCFVVEQCYMKLWYNVYIFVYTLMFVRYSIQRTHHFVIALVYASVQFMYGWITGISVMITILPQWMRATATTHTRTYTYDQSNSQRKPSNYIIRRTPYAYNHRMPHLAFDSNMVLFINICIYSSIKKLIIIKRTACQRDKDIHINFNAYWLTLTGCCYWFAFRFV